MLDEKIDLEIRRLYLRLEYEFKGHKADRNDTNKDQAQEISVCLQMIRAGI